ncbi:hypothetical protein ACEPAG_8840 [Sanghuangporus baumii]
MASAGNPSSDSNSTERGLRHRLSRISLTQGANDANAGRAALASRPRPRIQTVSPSDHTPSSHNTTSSPTADRSDDELLKRAKVFTDELYQPYKFAMSKYFYFDRYRGKVVLYLAARQKHAYVSRHTKNEAEIERVNLEVQDTIEDLERTHSEEKKEKGFGADGSSNDKSNADTEAFSENILKVLPICPIDKMIYVLSYLNKAIAALRKLCNTHKEEEISTLKEEYHQLLKDHRRLQQQQQSASQQAFNAATIKRTAYRFHSNVVELYQRAKHARHLEDEDYQLRIDRYHLTDKLYRQMQKTERLRRKLESPADAKTD